MAHILDSLAGFENISDGVIQASDSIKECRQFIRTTPETKADEAKAAGVNDLLGKTTHWSKTSGVTPRSSIQLITDISHAVTQFRIMHTQFLSADMHREFLRTFADFLGGYRHAVGQEVP